VVVLSSSSGWHESRLRRSFQVRGCEVGRCSLADIHFCTQTVTGFRGGDMDESLPNAVVVRGISAGSFEQITRRLDILHALEAAGVVVANSARTIERTVDKGMTTHLLARAGVATPPAVTTESESYAREVVMDELAAGHRLVAKPLFGSQGRGLVLLERVDQLPDAVDCQGVWHLQRFVDRSEKWIDWRVLVCESRAVARMTRRSSDWVTNRARGADCMPSSDDDDIVEMAIRAAEVCGCWYAGVDLVRDDQQRPWVLEVNGVPAWQGVQAASGVDVAEVFAERLLSSLNAAPQEV